MTNITFPFMCWIYPPHMNLQNLYILYPWMPWSFSHDWFHLYNNMSNRYYPSMHYSDAHNHNQRDILGFCSIFHWPNSVIKPLLINKAGTIESFSINQVYAMEGYFRKTISHTGHHTQSSLPALLRRASETSSPPWIITHYSMHFCGSRLFWE